MNIAEFEKQITETQALPIVCASRYLEEEPETPDQIFESVLDRGDKMAVIASSKMKKSFFVKQIGLSLAAGRDVFKWKIAKPRRVLYVQLEIKALHTHRRIKNLARAMGITPDDLGDRLYVLNGRGLGITGADGIERVKEAIAGYDFDVIIFDPLYKIATGVENAAEEMKSTLALFDELAEQTGAAIIFVHHDAKGSPGERDIRDRGAGSNVLGRDYDAALIISQHAREDNAAVVDILLRNYPPQEPFSIVWDCSGEGYCFRLADEIIPEKKTSRTKTPLPLASYLQVAETMLEEEMEISAFKATFKEKTGLSDHRIREFMNWATAGGNPPLKTREDRGRGSHKKWICKKDDS